MALITGSLLNDRELQRALTGLPEKLRNKALRQALRAAATPIRDDARQRAPRDTGNLARSIKVRTLKTRRRDVIGIAVVTGTRAELGIAANDRYYYPAALEFGTKHIKGRAFLRGALNAQRGSMLNTLQRLMRVKLDGVIASEIRRGLKKV